MFHQSNQTSTFEIGTYKPLTGTIQDLNPQHLRDLWVDHLVHEQLKLDQEYARKHPLSVEILSRKFFSH